MNRPDREWLGRRWFEMRTGYGTYMTFTFGFANFILLLHGLTDWFKDYPLHWFGIAMIVIIVPASVLIGHRHNRTQQKTEARNLARLSPFVDLIIPNSKEQLFSRFDISLLDYMMLNTADGDLLDRARRMKAALERFHDGEPATRAMREEGVD